MVEISVNKVYKNYGFNEVLNDISFDIKSGERVALVGSNGCGKTTLLRLINGLENVDSGNIVVSKSSKVGYLTQIPENRKPGTLGMDVYLSGAKELIDLENKINDFVSSMSESNKDIETLSKLQEEFRIKGGYEYKSKIEKIKGGFKLSDELLQTEYNSLSGGEKTIINLASLILSNRDILLLDEPTNHLDIETLTWFEEYLCNYKGTILIVSHDRYFMDRVVNKIISLEHNEEGIYHGNYSYYVKESEKRFILQFQKYKNQQKEIHAIEEAIKRLKEWGTKSDNPIFFRRAASMEKRLEKMDIIDKPVEKRDLKINLNVDMRSSNNILSIDKLNLYIGDRELLSNVSANIRYKDRVCLMGKNGTGKTTLIKNIMNNTHEEIKLGANIKMGYIPQEIRFDNEEENIYDYVRSFFSGNESEIRSKLSQFYFSSETITKKLKYLSGGEKVRLKLLELILKDANFLILDEPTNHIDIATREILEEALLNYEGSILFISHDRYFINKISTKIIRIENKKLVTYNCKYDEIDNKEEIKEVKEEKIVIKGSNRLNEFLKDATSIVDISKNNKKIYKIRKKSKFYILYIAPHLSNLSIRLDYLQDKLNITEKVFYEKYNGLSYLLTKDIKGISLDSQYYLNNKKEGINMIVSAFNDIYNVDYTDCTIDETIDTKIKYIEDNIKSIKNIKKEYLDKYINIQGIINYLKGNKPKQIIGFTHGNISLSNIYYSDSGIYFNSLESSGLSDIYYDLVSAEVSIEEIYGIEYIDMFYDMIGIERDTFKSEYYRLLIDLIN